MSDKLDMSKIVFPPAIPPSVLQCAVEAAESLRSSKVYVTALELIEIQGHELGIGSGLSLDDLKDFMTNLPRGTNVQAKAEAAYEKAASALVDGVTTLKAGCALAEELYHDGPTHDRLVKLILQFKTAEAIRLLDGPDDFTAARRAYSLLAWNDKLLPRAIAKLARSTRTQSECFWYLQSLNPKGDEAHFDEVFSRALDFCRIRDDFKAFENVLYRKRENYSWEDATAAHYRERLGEAIASFNCSRVSTLRTFDGVMNLKYEAKGSGPQSMRLERSILEHAIELANLEQLSQLARYWHKYPDLEEAGEKKLEKLAEAAVESEEDIQTLTSLLEHIPDSLQTVCLMKIIERQTSPDEARKLFERYRYNDANVEIATKAREHYVALARAAMASAQTPSQIANALAVGGQVSDVRRQGLAKYAAFYRIPEAEQAHAA